MDARAGDAWEGQETAISDHRYESPDGSVVVPIPPGWFAQVGGSALGARGVAGGGVAMTVAHGVHPGVGAVPRAGALAARRAAEECAWLACVEATAPCALGGRFADGAMMELRGERDGARTQVRVLAVSTPEQWLTIAVTRGAGESASPRFEASLQWLLRGLELRGRGRVPRREHALGRLSLTAPRAWLRQRGGTLTEGCEHLVLSVPGDLRPPGPAGVIMLGRGPAIGSVVETFRRAAEVFARGFGMMALADPRPVTLACGAPAAAMPLAGTTQRGGGLAVVVDDELYLLFHMAAHAQAAAELAEVFTSLAVSLPLRSAQPAAAVRPAEPLGGMLLERPAHWIPLEAQGAVAARRVWSHERELLASEARMRVPVVVEVLAERPWLLRQGLTLWIEHALRALGRELPRGVTRAVVGATAWRLEGGAHGATVALDEVDASGARVGRCVAHARTLGDQAIVGVAVLGPWTEGWRRLPPGTDSERVWECLLPVSDALLELVVTARARGPTSSPP